MDLTKTAKPVEDESCRTSHRTASMRPNYQKRSNYPKGMLCYKFNQAVGGKRRGRVHRSRWHAAMERQMYKQQIILNSVASPCKCKVKTKPVPNAPHTEDQIIELDDTPWGAKILGSDGVSLGLPLMGRQLNDQQQLETMSHLLLRQRNEAYKKPMCKIETKRWPYKAREGLLQTGRLTGSHT